MKALSAKSVLVLAGPTGSGKSALALALADRFKNIEIICADSITVYRGFNIGAAKPSKEEQSRCPHHLIDILDPHEEFTAGEFVRRCSLLIEEIHSRKAIPLVVGGTGFYIRALLWEMASEEENPEEAARLKRHWEEKAQELGWPALYQILMERDPGSAATVHANDHYRVLRALQAMDLYQKKWSEINQRARNSHPRYPDFRYFGLQLDRELLRSRVTERTKQMLAAGLMEEVKQLLSLGVNPLCKPMQSVGYKECIEALAESSGEQQLSEKIAQSTMRLAKSQMTWLRGERNVEWLEPDFLVNLCRSLMLES